MVIGVPRETKVDEYRVALLPVGAELLTRDGHTVLLERGAGVQSGFPAPGMPDPRPESAPAVPAPVSSATMSPP